MLVLLEEFDLIECLEETNEQEFTPEEDASQEVICELNEKREKRIKMERKCKSLLVQSVNDDLLELIKDKKTPAEMWTALYTAFGKKGLTNQLILKRKLLTMKMNENEELGKHFIKVDKIIRELKEGGVKIEEPDAVCHLLLTLPKRYEMIVTTLESLPQKN